MVIMMKYQFYFLPISNSSCYIKRVRRRCIYKKIQYLTLFLGGQGHAKCAVLRLRGLIYHMRVVFFYQSAENVLSYARLNCTVFNYFYMSLGQVRHTIVVSRYQTIEKITKFNYSASVRQSLN